MKKCKVYSIITEHIAKMNAIKTIKEEWMKKAPEGTSTGNFPQPSTEAIAEEMLNHPLVTFLYDGHILDFVADGPEQSGEFGSYAVVRKPDGFLDTVDIFCVQIEEGEV